MASRGVAGGDIGRNRARLRRAQKNTIWAWTAHPALTGRVGPQAQMNHASPPKGRASAFRECVVAREVSPPYIQ
jgi:hypothetical protein